MNMLFEFFPLLLFFGTLVFVDIYAAAVVLMVTMPIGLAVKSLRTGKIDKTYLWSTIFALVFGAMTLYFRNPYFLFWKPTAFMWVLAIAFLLSTWIAKEPLSQKLFQLAGELDFTQVTRAHWVKLNYAWVVFYGLAGLANIYVAYNFSEKVWGTFKVFGLMGLTFIFIIGQSLWIADLISEKEEEATEE